MTTTKGRYTVVSAGPGDTLTTVCRECQRAYTSPYYTHVEAWRNGHECGDG